MIPKNGKIIFVYDFARELGEADHFRAYVEKFNEVVGVISELLVGEIEVFWNGSCVKASDPLELSALAEKMCYSRSFEECVRLICIESSFSLRCNSDPLVFTLISVQVG